MKGESYNELLKKINICYKMRKTLVQVEREFITSGRSTGHLELQQTSKQVEAFTTVVLVKKNIQDIMLIWWWGLKIENSLPQSFLIILIRVWGELHPLFHISQCAERHCVQISPLRGQTLVPSPGLCHHHRPALCSSKVVLGVEQATKQRLFL